MELMRSLCKFALKNEWYIYSMAEVHQMIKARYIDQGLAIQEATIYMWVRLVVDGIIARYQVSVARLYFSGRQRASAERELTSQILKQYMDHKIAYMPVVNQAWSKNTIKLAMKSVDLLSANDCHPYTIYEVIGWGRR